MDGVPGGAVAVAGALVVLVAATLVAVSRWYRAPVHGTALIVKGRGPARVAFTRTLVLPVVHEAEVLDVAVHTIEVERRGRDGLQCRDNIRADVRAAFTVRVNRTAEDVLKVAETVGCARAGDHAVLVDLFAGRFVEALQAVAQRLDFTELVADRERYRDEVLAVLGDDLHGFVLDGLAIVSIEQTPLAQLDPDNLLDAEGIRRITERTAEERVRANELRQRMELDLARQDMRANEEKLRIAEELARYEAERLARR
ncbi:MAG: hypothetical protein JNL82_21335 [Myxococcales bacterium]|nr:hypothetical protein [Myxococcales bacterium]